MFAPVCWSIGLMLNLLLAALGLARLLVEPETSAELTPSYWVFMGAAAITLLAGAKLLTVSDTDPPIPHEVIVGVSIVLWSFWTWLIPMLVALGLWRYLVRGEPLRYEPGLWNMAFPVGMYGVAHRLGHATGMDWMVRLGDDEAWVVFAVWAVVFAGMLVAGWRALPRTRPSPA